VYFTCSLRGDREEGENNEGFDCEMNECCMFLI
jgi:hypothetical protein